MIARRALCLLTVLASAAAASTAAAQQGQPALGASPGGGAAAPAQTNPYDPSMQAGGLAPPPPMTTPEPEPVSPDDTERRLDDAKKEDSGRGLELIWLNVEGGYENVGLQTFNIDEEEFTAGFISSSANGGVLGAGAGVRLLYFTLGARGRVGFFDDWQLFSLGGEVGLHLPLGRLDPHVDLGFGYAGLGSFKSAVSGAADAIAIRGFYGRISGGLDLYLSPVFSIGANASWELLALTRPGLSTAQIDRIKGEAAAAPQQAKADLLAAEGSSVGSALALTAVAGLHF
ncbi:hypothetical protein [Sorangium cellulosum]|uniref:Outer membrane protein beta-barrel domain-containing protein n=2 Tax=Sorangium cellulosum TaxID=56 RepID=S4XWF4_SORCE|nr:hypothetical protein [Sorangium cellulosum]AGP34908.1 hypothetical protein SCE1572_10550 [Sorangium cellulosum So0157-2]